MAPTIRIIASSSNGDDGATRQCVDDATCNLWQPWVDVSDDHASVVLPLVVLPVEEGVDEEFEDVEDEMMEHAQQAEMMMLCVYPNTGLDLWSIEKIKSKEIVTELQDVVDSFKDLFAVPKKLPPQRSHDHRIPMI
ncbi:hypothetical protein Tco_0281864 [Tanacetum coccineum]